jgi:uncharacterized membrane-anchored protein
MLFPSQKYHSSIDLSTLSLHQAPSQAMTTVGAAAFIAGLYTYIMLYYIYYVYISVKSTYARTTKSTL